MRAGRARTTALVAVLAAAVAVVVGLGLMMQPQRDTDTARPAAPATSPAVDPTPVVTPSTTPSSSPTTSPSASSAPSRTAAAVPTTEPSPQPTRTAELKRPATISQELSAQVVKTEAVQGQADGPGEIAGPSVRFTIVIRNTTGKRVDLSNTVVNAYSGSDDAPAVPLQRPGGVAFPASVASGASVQGVYVFNIPTADRGDVSVTVDTSVKKPVVAFEGAAPK